MRSEIAKLKVGDEVKPEQVFTLSIIIWFLCSDELKCFHFLSFAFWEK